jgi:L-Lysine epsilon oxidase N-terminal/L-lysine epsilon oxidase C-terminal domain/Iron-containing redox enzyme
MQQAKDTSEQSTTISRCKIHPAIGIARVGDSSEEFFYGPERPGVTAVPEGGQYKDRTGSIKRQAARFRVFGYNDHGEVVRELTDEEAEIRWTVHLVNRKAAAPRFAVPTDRAELRNPTVHDRQSLVIDPGERTVSGRDSSETAQFDTGTFAGDKVDLGDLRTDAAGRLVVLGGHGRAGSPTDAPLTTFADNDGWYDETSDGPVRAHVRMRDTGAALDADPSWVIVAPPDFAPSIANIVTLYDIVEQVAFRSGRPPAPERVSFEQDIRPLLSRVAGYQWVDEAAHRGHRRGDYTAEDGEEVERRGDFLDPALLTLLGTPGDGEAEAEARRRVFRRVRTPLPDASNPVALAQAREQATASFMPPLSGDGGSRREGEPTRWLTVTPLQYLRLTLWADGQFDAGQPTPAGDPDHPTPTDLDRAALENCVGGGFFPGIEVSRRIKDGSIYADRYRLDHAALHPGALTERMAVPWQADFLECEGFWWPAQRPDRVLTEANYEAVVARSKQDDGRSGPFTDALAFPRRRWAREIADHQDMVDGWSGLGFVVPRGDPAVWIETERGVGREEPTPLSRPGWATEGLRPRKADRDREYFHRMLNLKPGSAFRPEARELAEGFFDEALAKLEHDPKLDSELNLFDYDEVTFRTRLDSIYQSYVDQVAAYHPAEDGTCHSRGDVVERIRQFGPMNRTDGQWLRNIEDVNEHPEVIGLLTRIWDDENGGPDRDPRYNHSAIYTELMRGLGLPTADVRSEEYVYDTRLLDSAFTVPLLQYVVSEFTEEFLPEILGMTLHLEWESVALKTNIDLFRRYGIDPTFYQLHLAIDNTAEGHGAMAVEAVQRYLANFHDERRQRQWRRIWTGYVAFRDAGTLANDLKALLKGRADRRPTPGTGVDPKAAERAVLDLILRKKPYGSLNHGGVTGTGMSNDLFDDPRHMLDVLRQRKIVVDGDPGASRLLALFGINQPMYKVFTEDEQQIWYDWIASLPPEVPPAPPAAEAGAASPPRYKRLMLTSSEAAVRADPRGRVRGRGAVQ